MSESESATAKVVLYWSGALVRRRFRALLDGLELASVHQGEDFRWKEQRGWLESQFSVLATSSRHELIRRWAKNNAEWKRD